MRIGHEAVELGRRGRGLFCGEVEVEGRGGGEKVEVETSAAVSVVSSAATFDGNDLPSNLSCRFFFFFFFFRAHLADGLALLLRCSSRC